MSLLARNQATFASTLARETGLNPHVVASWVLAEESAGAAQGYQGRGYNNWLNVAMTDSGPAGGAHSSVWRDPVTAARATAAWLRGQGPLAHEYGAPAPGIRAILSSTRSSPSAQIAAIARSGWASSGYSGGSALRSLYGQLSGEKLPKAPEGSSGSAGGAEGPQRGSGATLVPGNAGANNETLERIGELERELKGATVPVSGPAIPLPKLLQGAAVAAGVAPQKPNEALLSAVQQLRAGLGAETPAHIAPGSSPAAPEGHPLAGYVHPISGAKIGRTDQGLDLSAAPGTPVRSIGNGKVVGVFPDWYAGQPYVEVQLTDGPRAGQRVYYAEQITPQVKAGDRVRAGQRIGTVAQHGTALEFGWGGRTLGNSLARERGGYSEGQETAAGRDFARFYGTLR